MVVGAHADDIEFNAGATILKYRDLGYELVYVMSTNNMSGGWSTINAEGKREANMYPWHKIMPQRKKEAGAAAAFFGTEAIHLDHPQRHFINDAGQKVKIAYGAERPADVPPGAPTILTAHEDAASVDRVAALILEHRPEAVITHSMLTWNIEHIGTCLLISKAYTKARAEGHAGMLMYFYDITPPPVAAAKRRWDTFVDVSGYEKKKLDALKIHACQIPTTSHLRFPDFGAACGCSTAEVFELPEIGTPDDYTTSPFTLEILTNRR